MDYLKFSEFIGNLESQNCLMLFEPEILDFTDDEVDKFLHIHVIGGNMISLRLNELKDLEFIANALQLYFLSKGSKTITWNWKNFASYVLAKTGRMLECVYGQNEGAIIDLKIIESYFGIKNSAPKNLVEALNRVKKLFGEANYKESSKIYRAIHLPLMTKVIPHLETVGLLDSASSNKVHAYYEIDGQENGRLLCHNAYKLGYIPHNLTEQKKSELKPILDSFFMYFDFNSMEVFMLQWLSKDPLLGEMCQTDDVYYSLYEKIIGEKADKKESRDKCKKFFLPVIYGMSANTLADRLKVELSTAQSITTRINELFPTALAWVQAYQDQVKEKGYADDIFCKRRYFKEKEYRVRNFCVQSPASIVCLEKLIQLYYALVPATNLIYHVHDGYVIYATKENWKEIYRKGNLVLSSESELCPGLKLKVSCKAGRNLNRLANVAIKE